MMGIPIEGARKCVFCNNEAVVRNMTVPNYPLIFPKYISTERMSGEGGDLLNKAE